LGEVKSGIDRRTKLIVALGMYVVLGIVAFSTLENERVRMATILLLGMFAVRTLVESRRRREEGAETQE
jgi:hypothetical protein